MKDITNKIQHTKLSENLGESTFNVHYMLQDLFTSDIHSYYCTNENQPKHTTPCTYFLKIDRNRIDYKDKTPEDHCHFTFNFDNQDTQLNSKSNHTYTLDDFHTKLQNVAHDIDKALALVYIKRHTKGDT